MTASTVSSADPGDGLYPGNLTAVGLVDPGMMLRIGEVAQRAGVSVRALRYYEQQGLLEAERTPAGQRLFEAGAVDRVRLYQQFFDAGLTSRHIAELLPCIDAGHTDAEQRTMLRNQRARLQERVDDLTTVLTRLDEMIDVTRTHP